MQLLIIEAIICLIFTIFLYRRYAHKQISIYINLYNISIWYMTFMTILLLPFDIRQVLDPSQESDTYENICFLFFKIFYWTIFVILSIFQPVIQEYVSSKKLTAKEKLIEAIKTNVYTYLLLAFIGIGVLIYLIATKKFDR